MYHTKKCNDPKLPERLVWEIGQAQIRLLLEEQIVQTQIRLLLEEQSDQGLHYLQYCLHLLGALFCGKTSFFNFRMITAKFRPCEKSSRNYH